MSTQHTPGPWHYEPEDNLILSHDGRRLVTYSPRSIDVSLEERIANGRLIAAAPALLAALKLAENVLSHRPWSAETWPDGTRPMSGITAIRQAVADATGEPCGHCTPTALA